MKQKKRTTLQKLGNEQRFRFYGEFKKYGFKYTDYYKKHAVPTILLLNIKLINENDEIFMTDHLWFNLTKGFKQLGLLHVGDKVSFNGRVAEYTKGYRRNDKDYDIIRPSKVKLEENIIRPAWYLEESWEMCNCIYDMYATDYESRGIAKPYSFH
ncbi:hypothetical protein [Companilactobacillus formosensis]|jgi:hypothetical protein|uniref:hypothetical protein n=1 Tax=Companilactobacillus formosensis TaxID=1617889 RepID=UPI000E650DFF|nr:hypothetical protein [Companilactobacillus formosensis]